MGLFPWPRCLYIDLTSLSGIGKGSSVNESLYFIPLFLPQSGPFLWIGACCGAEVKRSFGKVPTGLDRPTAVIYNLAWVSSSGIKSFEKLF